ncbi:MAG TPA: hypothetical protein VLM75_01295 [Spirochaetota bacterium]|nr:hypothetical protein [Spirochaetota bacterium]
MRCAVKKAFAALACAIISAAVPFGSAEAARDIRKVRGIEFKGLYYLSRYEVLKQVAYRVDGDALVIDLGTLREGLDKMALIKKYSINEEGDRLTVVIEENVPVYVVVLDRDDALVPVELDAGLRVLSTGTIHAAERPIIVASAGELAGGRPSPRLRKTLETLSELEKNGMPVLREIEEIDMIEYPRLRVLLKGRRTVHTLEIDRGSFHTLNALVGYLDATRYYPARSEVRPGAAVLK